MKINDDGCRKDDDRKEGVFQGDNQGWVNYETMTWNGELIEKTTNYECLGYSSNA